MSDVLRPATAVDLPDVEVFLRDADLTLAGLDTGGLRLWVVRDHDGRVVGSTGYEVSHDGQHVLVRSVAVAAERRVRGAGTRLARFALERAADERAHTAWLFSRRSGPFWQSLGFTPADRDALASALATTEQVRLFRSTGQLDVEVAWSRLLDDMDPHRPGWPSGQGGEGPARPGSGVGGQAW